MSNKQTEEWQRDARHHVLQADDERFPQLLAEISNPPLLLYVDGDADILHLPALAIVGSRNPSKGGERNALSLRSIWPASASLSSAASHRASTRPRIGVRWPPAAERLPFWATASIGSIPPATRRWLRRSRQAARWSASFRSAPTRNANFPATQSTDQRPEPRHAGCRGGPPQRFADHRAPRRRARAGGFCAAGLYP